jgi:hypothetical protein
MVIPAGHPQLLFFMQFMHEAHQNYPCERSITFFDTWILTKNNPKQFSVSHSKSGAA